MSFLTLISPYLLARPYPQTVLSQCVGNDSCCHINCVIICGMAKRDYHRMLYDAKQNLAQLLTQRQALDQEIARAHRVVTELQNLCADQDQREFWGGADRLVKAHLKVGITEAVRVILQENFFPMTAVDLKKQIEARKLDINRYASPLAVIHTVLKRLITSGDVRVVASINGLKAYQWISSTDKALSELQKSTERAVEKRSGKESK